MVKRRIIHFTIEGILTQVSLYNIGVPCDTIAALYRINKTTMWQRLKEYEKFGLMKFRTRSETVSNTLSRKRKIPEGNKSELIKKWKKEFGKNGLIDILTIILLTDGHGNYKYKTISLSNKDRVLRSIFINLLEELNLNLRRTKDKRNNMPIVFSRQKKVREILNEVYKRTPTTKHQPRRGKQTWKKYLRETQPTLFLFYKRFKNLRKLLFRIGISFEGCVILNKTKNRYGRPSLIFTCFHPLLIEEWKNLAESIGINMIKSKNILYTSKFKSIINFLKMGGFIEGSKAGGNSIYFNGIEKNKILLSMLEYSYKESKNKMRSKRNSPDINKEIRKIIDDRKFKDSNFYIKHLLKILNKHTGHLTKIKIMKTLGGKPKRAKEIIQKTNLSEYKVRSALWSYLKKGEIIRVSRGSYFKK